jgi:hypothetical protein
MLRFAAASLLIMHGLAHITGLLGAWTSSQEFSDKHWLFSKGVTLRSTVGRAFSLLWFVALICLVGAGLGLLFQQLWWPTLAVAGAATSLVAIVPWLTALPPGAWAGALFDVLVIVALVSPWRYAIVQALK